MPAITTLSLSYSIAAAVLFRWVLRLLLFPSPKLTVGRCKESLSSSAADFFFLFLLHSFLSSLFIIVDTQMMMRKRSPDEYMLCVIDLYLDILNLFLHILKAVGKRN